MNTVTSRTAADAARLPIMLAELRLPTVRRLWSDLAEQANREGWPAERFLGTLLEREMSERQARRLARNRADSRLPLDKSLDSFDFAAVPAISKGHVTALAEADVWLAQGVEVRLRCLLRAVGEGLGEVVTILDRDLEPRAVFDGSHDCSVVEWSRSRKRL